MTLPAKYFVEIMNRNILGDVLTTYETVTPFPTFIRGDIIDTRTWETPYESAHAIISGVCHIQWEIEGKHVSYKVQVFIHPIDPEEIQHYLNAPSPPSLS